MKNTLFAILVLFTFALEASPRLLIFLGEDSNFSPDTFCEITGALCFKGTKDELKEQIERSDSLDGTHCIVIDSVVQDPPEFAYSLCYAHLILNGSLESSLDEFYKYSAELPLTDQDLPHMDPFTRGQFYHLMKKVDQFLIQNKILYWGISGTLLGAIRHQGMIPWDDDLDIAIPFRQGLKLQKLKAHLLSHGMGLYVYEDYFYKIYALDGVDIFHNEGKYPWKYPFIDVFPIHEIDHKMCIVSNKYPTIDLYPRWFLYPHELTSHPRRVPFGPLSLPIPNDPEAILNRHYGINWRTIAYAMYNHRLEKDLKRVRVQMTTYSSPPFVLPK